MEAKRGLVNVVRLLLDKRADPNVKNSDGETPLHHAALEGHSEVIRLLLNQALALFSADFTTVRFTSR